MINRKFYCKYLKGRLLRLPPVPVVGRRHCKIPGECKFFGVEHLSQCHVRTAVQKLFSRWFTWAIRDQYVRNGYGGSCGIPLLKHFFFQHALLTRICPSLIFIEKLPRGWWKASIFFSSRICTLFFLFPPCRDVRHCFWLLRQTSISAEMSTGKEGSLEMNLRPAWFLKNVWLRSTSTMTWSSWKCIFRRNLNRII